MSRFRGTAFPTELSTDLLPPGRVPALAGQPRAAPAAAGGIAGAPLLGWMVPIAHRSHAVKQALRDLLLQAIRTLQDAAVLPADLALPAFVVERARSREHGDFATNAAMLLAKPARAKPRELAEKLVAALPANTLVEKVEIAGPGFVNFFLSPAAYHVVGVRELDHLVIGDGAPVSMAERGLL